MRKITVIGIFGLVVAVILTFGPLFTGMYFQREYNKILAFYNSNQQIHIQLIEYKRHWFHSNALVKIKIVNSDFFDHVIQDFPKEYVLQQYIQHGPVIYYLTDGLPSLFGLAAIHNSLQLTPETTKLFAALGLNQNSLDMNDDFITFNGNYYKHIKFRMLDAIYPNTIIHVKLKEFEGEFWLWPLQERISGNLQFQGLSIADDQASITAPSIALQFDQHVNVKNFWLGNNSLLIPEINWVEEGVASIEIHDVNFNGFVEEQTGMLNGSRQFDIGKINLDDNEVGPLHLQFSVARLDAQAAEELLLTYHKIMQRGELYQSQLKQNIYMLLPDLITPGASVTLDDLEVKTPEGKLQMNGELNWALEKASIPDNLMDLLQVATARLDLRVSKDLINKWITFAANFSLFNRAGPDLQQVYQSTRKEVYQALQQNSYIIIELVRQNLLTDKDAVDLLTLQKQMVSMDNYSDELSKLLLEKSISLETNHILILSYAEVQNPLFKLNSLIKQNQDNAQQGLQSQLVDWIKRGYVKQEQNNYIVSIYQGQNGIKINEKLISN